MCNTSLSHRHLRSEVEHRSIISSNLYKVVEESRIQTVDLFRSAEVVNERKHTPHDSRVTMAMATLASNDARRDFFATDESPSI